MPSVFIVSNDCEYRANILLCHRGGRNALLSAGWKYLWKLDMTFHSFKSDKQSTWCHEYWIRESKVNSPCLRCVFLLIIMNECAFLAVFSSSTRKSLQWRHYNRDGVSNHRRLNFNSTAFRRRSKITSKLRLTGLCEGNSPVTFELPAQRASNAEKVSIWRCHHDHEQIASDMTPCKSHKICLHFFILCLIMVI